jgi:YfiR/HmsC-like
MKRNIIVAFFALLATSRLSAQTTNHTAYSLFVVSFAKYSSWPQPGSEFTIVVLGKSKVYDELVKLTANKNLNGLAYKIVQAETIEEVGDAQLVYLSDNKSSSLDELNKATEGKPTMIVAEREGLAKKGAAFSLLVLDNKLRFDVNNAELEKRHIKVSSSLMNLANQAI